MQDRANHRSLHQGSIPRFGGVGINLGIAAAVLLVATSPRTFLAPWLGVFVLSLTDDIKGLSWHWRLLFQFLLCVLVTITLGIADSYWIVLATLVIAWCTNLYNFMDGMDGLAGSMGLIGFATLGLAGLGHFPFAIAAACLGFLFFNWPKARVFMGDSGSTVLGFLAATLSIQGVLKDLVSPIWPVLVFFPFVYDASITLVRRALQGKRVWEAHREHLYQRAVLSGFPVIKVLWGAISLMLLCGAVALATQSLGWKVHLLCAFGLLVLHGLVDWCVGRKVFKA